MPRTVQLPLLSTALIIGSLLLGVRAHAASAYAAGRTLADFIQRIVDLIEYAIPLLMALALLVFIFGAVRFIYGAGDPKARSEGRMFLLWGIIGLAVMVSVWGLVIIIGTTFFGA